MAKKSKHRTRDASAIASRQAGLGESYKIKPAALQFKEVLYHDRRFYKPDKTTRPPTHNQPLVARVALQIVKVRQRRRVFHAKIASYTDPTYKIKSHLRKRLGFSVSRRMEACIRRWTRKEVLFAKRKTGKAGQKKPVRNFWSALSCQRRK